MSAFDPSMHHRRSIRRRDYDYSSVGAYFVTLCVQDRVCLLGCVNSAEPAVSAAGVMVKKWWIKLPEKFPGLELDEYMIMPNHIHGILVLASREPIAGAAKSASVIVGAAESASVIAGGRPHGAAPTVSGRESLGSILRWFKTMSTNEYIRNVKVSGWKPFHGRLWQRDFFDRVIRDEDEMERIREYILMNPARWAEDKYYQTNA